MSPCPLSCRFLGAVRSGVDNETFIRSHRLPSQAAGNIARQNDDADRDQIPGGHEERAVVGAIRRTERRRDIARDEPSNSTARPGWVGAPCRKASKVHASGPIGRIFLALRHVAAIHLEHRRQIGGGEFARERMPASKQPLESISKPLRRGKTLLDIRGFGEPVAAGEQRATETSRT